MQPLLKREVGEVGRWWEGSSPTLAWSLTLSLGFPLQVRWPCLQAGPLQSQRPAGLRSDAQSGLLYPPFPRACFGIPTGLLSFPLKS